MDRTLLPSLGIVAGIMTLAYYVGGSKEVRWAESHSAEEIESVIEDKDGFIPFTDTGRVQNYFKDTDWKSKDYPYEKRVVFDNKTKWCENCGELDDSDEDAWNHYQFVLKQKNSSTPAMRYISGGDCEGCGTALCQNCIDGDTSGNYNPLFNPMCDDCLYPFCRECKSEDEDRCNNCEEVYQANVCDCCGHVHHAESETFESPVSCNICGKTFDSFRGLNGHMNAHIPAHRKRTESFAAEVPDKYKEPFKVPVVKIYGENGAIVIGHGVREYLIQEIKYAYVEATGTTYLHAFSKSGLQKKSTQELVDILDHYLKEQDNGGASLEYHDMDGWVGWQIPDFGRE